MRRAVPVLAVAGALAVGILGLGAGAASADPPPPPNPPWAAVGDPVPSWAPGKPAEFWLGEPVVWTTGWGGRWCIWKNGQIITLSSNPVTNGG
jgi:hypothetical protein